MGHITPAATVSGQSRRYNIWRLADSAISLSIVKIVVFVFPEALVNMHPGTVILEKRLGHKSYGETLFNCDILANVFIHHFFSACAQCIESHAELCLTCGGDFMMVIFDVDAGHYLQGHSERRSCMWSVGGTGNNLPCDAVLSEVRF